MSIPMPPASEPWLGRVLRRSNELAWFAVRRAREERIGQVAGSLTFTTLLAFVPLLTIVLAVLTALPLFAHMQDQLRALFIEHLMPSTVSDSIFRYLNQFAARARGLTLIGLVFLAITALSTMLTVDRALNQIWHVRRPRSLPQRILVYWTALTVGPLLFGLSVTLSSYLASASFGFVSKPPAAVALLINFVPLVLLSFAYAALYVYVPNRHVEWRHALFGGVVAAAAFELAKRGFAVYVARFPTYTAVYGAVAALPIFLLWVYISWLITLSGAVIAASLPLLEGRRWQADAVAGSGFADALRVLRALREARAEPLAGISSAALVRRVRIEPDEIELLLYRLERAALVIRLRPLARRGLAADHDDIWVLAADQTRVCLSALFRMFAYDGKAAAEIGFARGDRLAAIVAATPLDTLDMTLAEVLA